MSKPSIVCSGGLSADAGRDRGQQVHGHCRLAADSAGGDHAWQAGYERLANATFPAGALAFAQWSGRAGMLAVAEPGAIVAGENDERSLVKAVAVERGQHFTHRPVDFLDHISKEAA